MKILSVNDFYTTFNGLKFEVEITESKTNFYFYIRRSNWELPCITDFKVQKKGNTKETALNRAFDFVFYIFSALRIESEKLAKEKEEKEQKTFSTAEKIELINAYFDKHENRKYYIKNGILFCYYCLSGYVTTEGKNPETIHYILNTLIDYIHKKEKK